MILEASTSYTRDRTNITLMHDFSYFRVQMSSMCSLDRPFLQKCEIEQRYNVLIEQTSKFLCPAQGALSDDAV